MRMIAESRRAIMTAQTTISISKPVVLCPLHFEARALRSLHKTGRMEVRALGPGPDAVRAAVAEVDNTRPLILAGLAASVCQTLRAGQATWISAIHGVEQRPTMPIGNQAPHVIGVQVDSVLHTPAERSQVARASGAAVADMECEAFARAASKRSGPWGVVRGISDDTTNLLPPVECWVDEQGRARVVQALAHLLVHPWQIPGSIRLANRSAVAMGNVQTLLMALE